MYLVLAELVTCITKARGTLMLKITKLCSCYRWNWLKIYHEQKEPILFGIKNGCSYRDDHKLTGKYTGLQLYVHHFEMDLVVKLSKEERTPQ